MASNTKKIIKEEEKALRKREKENKKKIKRGEIQETSEQGEGGAQAVSPELVQQISDKIVKGIDNSKYDELMTDDADSGDTKRIKRKRRIAYEKTQKKLQREKLIKDNEMVQAVVPVKMYEKFVYYSTSLRTMEKINRRLRVAVALFVAATIAFASLFIYELGETRRTYEHMYKRSVNDTIDLVEGYMDNPIDSQRFSRMLMSELNTIRMSADLLKVNNDYTNKLNDLHFLMVDYPEQMESHYEELEAILKRLKKNVSDKKAYELIDELTGKIDKLGK